MSSRRFAGLALWALASAVLLGALHSGVAGLAGIGPLLDPVSGLYHTARRAEHLQDRALRISGLEQAVSVERDERGVPHIFAASDRDAIIALGFIVAQDRLFQMDFLSRVASGRLAEIFGSGSARADRFLRQTGMDWAARKIVAAMEEEAGVEQALTSWFAIGANAYIDALDEANLPFEFKLFGYRPERYSALHAARLVQYFNYDLSFQSDEAAYSVLMDRLGKEEYERLYPRHSSRYAPIIPEPFGGAQAAGAAEQGRAPAGAGAAAARLATMRQELANAGAEGYRPPKGSNNWAVSGALSTTGAPILAGDMHLGLALPAIWYEAHLVTPHMNTYGVLAPGAPVIIEGFNDYLGWTFTNAGVDAIDHFLLELDESSLRYRYQGEWVDLVQELDTILVRGEQPIIEPLYYAHFGPVIHTDSGAVAVRWVAHDRNLTLTALWGMNRARSVEEFDTALHFWGAAAQNILYADAAGNIAIRSTGHIPLRRGGHGVGLLDGDTDAFEWTGMVPFDELPYSRNPAQGFLTSTNQQPTRADYPYYLGHNWEAAFRSLRIDSLLKAKPRHSAQDLMAYQADVHVVQRGLFMPFFASLSDLSERAQRVRDLLLAWSGEASVDRIEPLLLFELMRNMRMLAWDEPVFDGLREPNEMIIHRLLEDGSPWLDVQATPEVEDVDAFLRLALNATVDALEERYGWDTTAWRWGERHKLVVRHLTQTPALKALWSGPHEYPGFDNTLSPAEDLLTTHSASWRVVVDFAPSPPVAYGVYPGGQSGNPFSAFYDLHVPTFLQFDYYKLHKPDAPGLLSDLSSRLTLRP